MKLIVKAEQFFWILMIISVLAGLFAPSLFIQFEGIIIYIIMIIMGLLFLKVDIVDVLTHIKKPYKVIYICMIKLLLFPILIYFIFNQANLSLQMALFLLAALPTGVSSAVFTDIMKGRTSLNLTIVIISNLLSVFTIPFLFFIFYKTTLNIDVMLMFTSLLKIIFIPFIIAKVIKRIFIPNIVKNLQSYLNFKIIILLSLMIAISISVSAETLLATIQNQFMIITCLFACFFAFQLIGYFSIFWKSKEEKLASSNSCMIMNNILGIVLAIAFFDKPVLNIIILSLIPWNAMIILKHFYKNILP